MTQPNEDTGYINALRAEVDHVSKKVKEMHRDVFEKHFADSKRHQTVLTQSMNYC